MANNIYFFCCTGGDLLICSGISRILKDLDYENNTTLLLPAHPRVTGKAKSFSVFFDEIIELPFCCFSNNPFVTIKEAFIFKKSLSKIKFPDKSLFFIFDVYELAELLFYDTIYNLKNNRKITVISAFDSGELNKKNRKLVIKGSILKSLYSIIFTGNFFFEFKTKNSSFNGLNFYNTNCDLQVCIKGSGYISTPLILEQNVSYPPNIFLKNDKNFNLFPKLFESGDEVIILLVESTFAAESKDYWKITNSVINKLFTMGFKIFVKDHPSANFQFEECMNIDLKKINVLNNSLNLEELFIANQKNIKAVLGYGSTALITASWLGIRSINLSELYNFDELVKKRFNNFITLGNDIKTISSLLDIVDYRYYSKLTNNDTITKSYNDWKNIMTHLNTKN